MVKGHNHNCIGSYRILWSHHVPIRIATLRLPRIRGLKLTSSKTGCSSACRGCSVGRALQALNRWSRPSRRPPHTSKGTALGSRVTSAEGGPEIPQVIGRPVLPILQNDDVSASTKSKKIHCILPHKLHTESLLFICSIHKAYLTAHLGPTL